MGIGNLPPIALLVEDNETALEIRKKLFEAKGFLAITATSYEAAVSEFNASSIVDILVTDLDLGEGPTHNSGFDVAEKCREIRPEVPRVAYSGAVEEGQFSSDKWAVFSDKAVNKAAPGDSIKTISERIDNWKVLAKQHQQNRISLAFGEIERIKRKYQISEGDLQPLMAFLPGLPLPGRTAIMGIAEVNLPTTMQVIEKGQVRPLESGGTATTTASISVWIYEDDDCVIAELLGFPGIFADGQDLNDAIENLLILMDGFYNDFREDRLLSNELRELRKHLQRVFG